MSNNTEEVDLTLVDELGELIKNKEDMLIRAFLAVELRGADIEAIDLGDLLDEAPEEVAVALRKALAAIAILSTAGVVSPLTRENLYGLLHEREVFSMLATLSIATSAVDLEGLRSELAKAGVEGFTHD